MNRIGVREKVIFSFGLLRKLLTYMLLAFPTFRQFLSPENPDSEILFRETTDDLPSPVGGLVVQHQNLIIGIILTQQGTQTAGDIFFLVPRRNHHRHFRQGNGGTEYRRLLHTTATRLSSFFPAEKPFYNFFLSIAQ
jgi:hypothetical protein